MVDLQILREQGCSAEDWKKKLEHPPFGGVKDGKTQDDKITALRNRIRDRINAGRNRNFQTAKTYYALDVAWDTALKQIPPTLLRSMENNPVIPAADLNKSSVTDILNSWGIDASRAFIEEDSVDPKIKSKVYRINVPELIKILVPLMKAYITIRWAKLTNDRRVDPFLQYDPAINTKKNRARCEAITSAIQVQARQYGYFNVMKQAVLKMLLYGICLVFPLEEWHTEEQLAGDPPDDSTVKKNGEDKTNGNGKEKKSEKKYKTVVVKQGIRYHHPHPSRMYWDQAHRVGTFNTDSGCTFGGYWRVLTYKDLRSNKGYYNTDKVSYGTGSDWSRSNLSFFNTVYPCVINFPCVGSTGSGPSNDRETKVVDGYYNSGSDDDKSVVLVEHFEKLNPKECGLGDYDFDIWARFVVASDDTIVYAAPLAYCPINYYGYDPDEYRDVNTSLGLETLPFQGHFENTLTQILLTTKQNLTNLTFIDEDAVPKNYMAKIVNLGERFWRTVNIIPFSRKKWERQQINPKEAVTSHKFPFQDVVGLMNTLRTILDTLERILVMSSQEVAQAASHEQTREEVRNIAGNTSSRLQFTAGGVDDGLEAMKVQLYHALMAYGEDEFYTQIPSETGLTKKMLDDLGFTYAGEDDDEEFDEEESRSEKRIPVKVTKTAIAITSFASARDSTDRLNNTEVGVAMMNTLRDWMGNPILAQAIQADQAIDLANMTVRMAGFPRDFKLRNMTPKMSPEEQAANAKQQLDELVNAVMAQVQEGLMPTLEAVKANSAAIEELNKIVGEIQQRLMQAMAAPVMAPPPPPVMVPPPGMIPPGMIPPEMMAAAPVGPAGPF